VIEPRYITSLTIKGLCAIARKDPRPVSHVSASAGVLIKRYTHLLSMASSLTAN
jgi:hypothetical protein